MSDAQSQAGFLHMVYFYLKNAGSREDTEALLQGCRTYLPGIPGVRRFEVGTPAGTPRDVVDNGYGVALLVEFADAGAHDVYQDHPDHLRFIEACRHLWSRVQVYDTLLVAG